MSVYFSAKFITSNFYIIIILVFLKYNQIAKWLFYRGFFHIYDSLV